MIRPSRSELFTLGAILVAAALLRIFWNDVAVYSPADERFYVHYTRFLVEHGWLKYPELVHRHIADRGSWEYPPPLRWGWLAITTLFCHLAHRCDERTLAWLSTLAGIASVGLVYRLGARLSTQVGLVAAALSVSSPLQLALGRRALQDEGLCVIVLGLLNVLFDILDDDSPPTGRRYAAAIALMTLAFAVKEAFFLFYPPLIFLFALAVRRRGWRRADVALFALPPLLYMVGFVVCARSLGDFFQLLSIVNGVVGADYPRRFQAGPPHRIALDLFTLAPLVCLFAVAAVAWLGRARDDNFGLQNLAWLSVGLMLMFAISPSKNVRYAVALDPLARILAAWALVQLARGRTTLVWAAVALNAAAELLLFHQIFIVARTYDPVSDNLLRALQVIP